MSLPSLGGCAIRENSPQQCQAGPVWVQASAGGTVGRRLSGEATDTMSGLTGTMSLACGGDVIINVSDPLDHAFVPWYAELTFSNGVLISHSTDVRCAAQSEDTTTHAVMLAGSDCLP